MKELKVDILTIKYSKNRSRVLKLHRSYDIINIKDIEVNIFTCTDNGAMLFNLREDIIKASKLIYRVIAK